MDQQPPAESNISGTSRPSRRPVRPVADRNPLQMRGDYLAYCAEWEEKIAMDKFLNTKLERDKLPPDTPLPIYLSYREPRSISPESTWDKDPKYLPPKK